MTVSHRSDVYDPQREADQIAGLFAAEQLFDIAEFQLHPGWPAVIALSGKRGRFHVAQERIHFFRTHAPARDAV